MICNNYASLDMDICCNSSSFGWLVGLQCKRSKIFQLPPNSRSKTHYCIFPFAIVTTKQKKRRIILQCYILYRVNNPFYNHHLLRKFHGNIHITKDTSSHITTYAYDHIIIFIAYISYRVDHPSSF